MKTTFELRPKKSGIEKKRIQENLHTLENVHDVFVNEETASITFEYLLFADLGLVRRQLNELGYTVINDAQHFDNLEYF